MEDLSSIEVFVFKEIRGNPCVAELYQMGGKNPYPLGKHVKRFNDIVTPDVFCKAMCEVLNVLEENNYQIISVVYNPTALGMKRYEIYTRLLLL